MDREQPKDWEQSQQINRKRAQTTAIVFGIITAISLASMVFAFVQKGIADDIRLEAEYNAVRNAERAYKNAQVADSLRIKLEQCAEAAREASQKALKK